MSVDSEDSIGGLFGGILKLRKQKQPKVPRQTIMGQTGRVNLQPLGQESQIKNKNRFPQVTNAMEHHALWLNQSI